MNLHRRRKPRVSALSASMLGTNENDIPRRSHDDDPTIGLPEIAFLAGFLLAAVGLGMMWLPLAPLFAGAVLAIVAWQLA